MIKKQNITIKGTKEGLTLHLDDTCSFQEILLELDEKLSATYMEQDNQPLVTVNLQAGNRYLTLEQEEELKQLIRKKKNFVVDHIYSNVITKEEANRLKEELEVISVSRIVRSGQVLKVPGDLLLIGDVNPGGTVIAGGNIFVLGSLKGTAHAGYSGNRQAVIAASLMKPSQLRISNLINRAPDQYSQDQHEMECAYIDESNQIIVDRLQVLMHLRPNLTRLEGGR